MDKYKRFKGYYRTGGNTYEFNPALPPYLMGTQQGIQQGINTPQVRPTTQPYDPHTAFIYDNKDPYIGTQTSQELNMPAPASTPAPSDFSKFQFSQPYGGYDLPTSTYLLGDNIQRGDALGIASTGFKTLAGVGKGILSGMGQARSQQEAQRTYWENIRDYVSGADNVQNLEEGGTIGDDQINQLLEQVVMALQSSSPEEVVQILVSEGMPQDQAVGLVETALQGAQQTMMRKGGTIKSYKLDAKTNEYIVEYE